MFRTPAFPTPTSEHGDVDDESKELDIEDADDEEEDDYDLKLTKPKAKWPRDIKDGESDDWSRDDWLAIGSRVQLAALRYGPDGERVLDIYKETPYFHMIEKLWRDHVIGNQELINATFDLTPKQRRNVLRVLDGQQLKVIKKMLDAIMANVVISKGDHVDAQELITTKMRYLDEDVSKCTVAKYKKYVLKLLKAFDVSIPGIQNIVTEAIVQGVTPILQQRLDMRLPNVGERRWQSVLMVLEDLENKFTEADWITHAEQLEQQAKIATASINQSYLPRHVKDNILKNVSSKKKKLPNGQALTMNGGQALITNEMISKARICWKCGHRHFIPGIVSACISPPDLEAAKRAKDEFHKKRNESGQGLAAQIKELIDRNNEDVRQDDSDLSSALRELIGWHI